MLQSDFQLIYRTLTLNFMALSSFYLTLLFTTKFPVTPGTHFMDLGRMKG